VGSCFGLTSYRFDQWDMLLGCILMALSVCEYFGLVNSTRRKLVFTRGYGGNEGLPGLRPFSFGI
jgi:hypothetical protein